MESCWRATRWEAVRRLAITAGFALVVVLAAWASVGTPGGAGASSESVLREAGLAFAIETGGQMYLVAVDFLIVDNGDGRFEADAQGAREDMLARFPGAVALPDDGVRAQYVLNGYWWPGRTLAWGYNASGKPTRLTGDEGALAQAGATWTASGANVAFTGGAASSADTGACSGRGVDGRNTVGWAAQSGNTLAVTCTWYGGTGSPKTASEFDMQIDPGWAWTTGGSTDADLQSVVTHEFGHALGLGHSPDPKSVMSATYVIGSDKRKLTADDLAAVVALYGATVAPPPPVPPPAAGPTALALLPGANLLTWPGANVGPAAALGSQGVALRVVYAWNAATGEWQRYGPGLPAYANSLAELRQGQPYWFIASGSAQIPFSP